MATKNNTIELTNYEVSVLWYAANLVEKAMKPDKKDDGYKGGVFLWQCDEQVMDVLKSALKKLCTQTK
jgi:hypothetical protein